MKYITKVKVLVEWTDRDDQTEDVEYLRAVICLLDKKRNALEGRDYSVNRLIDKLLEKNG